MKKQISNKQVIERTALINAVIKAYSKSNDKLYFELLNAFESLIYDELKKDSFVNVYQVSLSNEALKMISKK